MIAVKNKFRAAFRFGRILILLVGAASDFIFLVWLRGKSSSLPARAHWLQYWSQRWLRIMNCQVTVRGNPPRGGVLTANHLSYMDVLVLASIRPFVFVSKAEVKSWPVVGAYTRCAGTLYLRRQSRSDVVRLGNEMVPVVSAGLVVVLFLEGTSTNGETLLPFRSSLLAPAEEHGWPASAAWIHYSMKEGSVSDEVCYWGDMTFFPHILNLFSRESFEAFVNFGEPLAGKLDRKEMALALHHDVQRMKDEYFAESTVGTSRCDVPARVRAGGANGP